MKRRSGKKWVYHIILLQQKNGKLSRRSEPLTISDRLYEFKPVSDSTVQSFEKGILYDKLIKQHDENSVNYFQ